ncbi:hypothetical protein RJ640_022240 [Escallonia rubra]|uniref:Uncharacterized protein n=1 Tax=Escallonia rubra TaxID=112253 RepID=A0AA88TYJ1_9ASTE|nr:hypothetical protein RJ640_022240 [Escallonia rubra]
MKGSITTAIRGAIPDSDNAKLYLAHVEEQFQGFSTAHATTLIIKMVTFKYNGSSCVREHILRMNDMASQLKGLDMEISEGFLVGATLPHIEDNDAPEVVPNDAPPIMDPSIPANEQPLRRKSDNLEVIGYSDSDYARCVDSLKSTSGYVFMLAEGPISWKSAKQSLMASHTMEVEFVASFEASCHSVRLKNFITGLKVVDTILRPLKIFCDIQDELGKWCLNVSLFRPFESLINLSLAGNQLVICTDNEGVENKFSKLRNLEVLDLPGNNLDNSVLSSVSGLASLKSLDLGRNSLKGSINLKGWRGDEGGGRVRKALELASWQRAWSGSLIGDCGRHRLLRRQRRRRLRANFVSLKLSTSNYLLWETQMLSLIESQDLLGFINGDIVTPDSEVNSSDGNQRVPNPDFTSWVCTDRLVKAWITGTLSEEALGVVVGLRTSTDVWKALGDAFSQNSQAREFKLLAQLQVKKGNASLSDHLRNFKKTCDQWNAIGKPVTDQNKVFWLLSGLGPKFNHPFQAIDIPKALAAMHVTDSQDSEWFSDTEATAHITEDPNPSVLDQRTDQLPTSFPPTELENTSLSLKPQSGAPLVVPNSTPPFTIPSTTSATPPFPKNPNLGRMFSMTDLGPLHFFLGIQVDCNTPDGLFLHQSNAKKQSIVARSSAETEYRAMASTTAELTWLSFILRDIGIVQHHPATLFCDNLAALYMSINPVFRARTKHIEVDYHFVREKVALGSLVTRFVSSDQQLADIFTKPLSRDAFQHL